MNGLALRRNRVAILLLSVLTTLAAQATYVCRNISSGDSRYMMTGCCYADKITTTVSFGMWAKDVGSSDLGSLGGTGNANQGFNIRGFHIVTFKGSWGFSIIGTDANGTYVRNANQTVSDMSWCTDGKWHFIMLTIDIATARKAKLYLDGVCVKEINTNSSMVTFAAERGLAFGGGCCAEAGDTQSPSRSQNGVLQTFAEVSLYDRVLSAEEIVALTTKRADPFDEHLIGYWPCNESGGAAHNWALYAARRNDGSFVTAMDYYVSHQEDAEILPFEYPAGFYVVTPEFAAEHGYTVPAAGTASWSYRTLGCPSTNLVDAFTAAAAGQSVYVAPGVYNIASTITLEKNINVIGYDPLTHERTKAAVLDGGYPARTNRIMKLKQAKLDHLTFRNGATTATDYYSSNAAGGGALCLGDNSFRVTDCDFIGNRAIGIGGGAVASHGVYGEYFFTRCNFIGNFSESSGGSGFSQYDNEAHWIGYQDCHFISNSVAAEVKCSVLYSSGRGLRCRGCFFKGNHGVKATMIRSGQTVLENCIFDGAGIDPSTVGSPACLVCEDSSGSSIISNTVIRNFSIPGKGLFTAKSLNVDFWGLVVTNNNCGRFGDTYLDADPGAKNAFRNCLFADNAVAGEAFLYGHFKASFENCTFANNDFSNKKLFTHISSYYDYITFVNCLFSGNRNLASMENYTQGVDSLTVSNSVMQCAVNGANDSKVWYRSVPLDENYRLPRSSFAREKGLKLGWMTNGSVDLDGNPRLMNRSGVAYAMDARPDLGCFEQQQSGRGLVLTFH